MGGESVAKGRAAMPYADPTAVADRLMTRTGREDDRERVHAELEDVARVSLIRGGQDALAAEAPVNGDLIRQMVIEVTGKAGGSEPE